MQLGEGEIPFPSMDLVHVDRLQAWEALHMYVRCLILCCFVKDISIHYTEFEVDLNFIVNLEKHLTSNRVSGIRIQLLLLLFPNDGRENKAVF